ncbi:MAG: bifunctional protein-serine/threonine kinase/phosphatase [Opitutus sp.]|nr:bifunctional protein-serine/threonine kinase/phosphatase [Opitutus sp.]
MKVLSTGHALPRHAGASCDDAWAVRERGGVLVAALADGVGSSREGGTAARRAVEMLADYCLARPRAWSARRALAEFTAQINRHLHSESLERHGQPELACTLSAVLLESGRLYGCNVGDSPVMLWRRGHLQRLSESHNLAQSDLSHVLTRAVGFESGVEPFFFETELVDGDVVLLCSDGVTAIVPETRLAELLSRHAAARSIVSAAKSAAEGNPDLADDTSAIVLEIVERGGAQGDARQKLEVIPAPVRGDMIDGYRLVRPLATGERVWVAEDAEHRLAVLKFPPTEAADVETVRDGFVREAWNAARLVSPDLVRAWIPEGATLRYYAMEYVDAPTLRTALLTARLGTEEARELGQFLLRVGQFLLQHDLAHGDLKPDNILVLRRPAGTAFRLLDLGSAAELFSVTSRAGTPSYLAPERFSGGAISERTEIFAIGVTLYEALTGAYPFGEVERFQTPRFDAPARRPTKLNPAIPPWLESIILHAIEPMADRRYQNYSEISYDLSHPAQVAAHHRKDTPLLERNPVLFYQLLCGLMLAIIVWLLGMLARRQ